MTGGVGAIYLGGVLPTPADVLVRVGGIAAAGFGLYHLFAEDGTAPPAKGATQSPLDTPSPEAFDKARGVWLYPVTGTKPESNFWSSGFDAKIIWYNGSDKKVNFTYDVYANIWGVGFIQPGVNQIYDSIYQGTVKLDPGQNSGPVVVTLPIYRPPKPGLVGSGLPDPTFKMSLQLRKYDDKGVPIPTGDPIVVGPWLFSTHDAAPMAAMS
jgi:hypothetical protein